MTESHNFWIGQVRIKLQEEITSSRMIFLSHVKVNTFKVNKIKNSVGLHFLGKKLRSWFQQEWLKVQSKVQNTNLQKPKNSFDLHNVLLRKK